MADGLTPAQAAAAVKDAVGGWGFTWMSDAGVRARGKAELGLRGRPLYHLGRGGALGDVPVEVVVAAEAFFPPEVVRAAWEQGRAVVEPLAAAVAYAGFCADVFRERHGDRAGLPRLVELLEPVVDGAEAAGLPLFAGWRALPRPDDAAGRAGLLLNVLREHRGSVHAAACAAVGLGPLEAIMAGSYGEANARFFEWPEPYPDPAPYRARWDAAEELTAAAAGPPYDMVSAAERVELVDLVNGTLAG
ncbi:MAG: hypothetical protein WD794_08825 [Mycobacteriales bacterium]